VKRGVEDGEAGGGGGSRKRRSSFCPVLCARGLARSLSLSLSLPRALSVLANASLFLCATGLHSRCGGLDSIAVVWKTKKRKETEKIENTLV
jgi:hypothetical protein